MHDVAIIGAGELGGMLAHVLARRDVVSRISLIDDAGRIASGKALDIMQAAPIESFSTRVIGSTDLSVAGVAAVVVLADRTNGSEWQGEDGLMALKQLGTLASSAVLICAGASQRELVERGVRELHIARARLFGSAPEALAGAARAVAAVEANRSPSDVSLTVVGVPPSRVVILWDDATIAGFSAIRVLDEPTRRRIVARLPALWPPGPYALACAAANAVQNLLRKSQRITSCFVGPDDTAGTRTRAAALPAILGAAGIEQVVLPRLNVHDRLQLDNAMML